MPQALTVATLVNHEAKGQILNSSIFNCPGIQRPDPHEAPKDLLAPAVAAGVGAGVLILCITKCTSKAHGKMSHAPESGMEIWKYCSST